MDNDLDIKLIQRMIRLRQVSELVKLAARFKSEWLLHYYIKSF